MRKEAVNRVRLRLVIFTTPALMATALPAAAMSVGGSVGVTSDYLVRGISRSQHHGSLQADAHIVFNNGFDAGVFAASVQISPTQPRDTEVSAFVGFATNVSEAWHSRVAINHYSYPWSRVGSKYDYDELNVDMAYRQWLTFSAVYSPNAPRYVYPWGILGVTAKSAELSAQVPLSRQLVLAGGLGYARLAGPYAEGYAYWSVGGSYALGGGSISLQYVSTTDAARQLYHGAAAHSRVAGTVIWRF